MPIYLEDVTAPALPQAHMAALLRIADAAIGKVVTPAVAMRLLREHLGPIVSADARKLVEAHGQARWDHLQVIYADLLALSEGSDRALVATAFVVDVVWRHSTRPARTAAPQHSVDVASFLRICGYARLIVPSKVQLPSGRSIEPLRFCRFCWRITREGAPVCTQHTMGRHVEAHSVAEYKHAQRLRPLFEREIVELATREELQFHESEFTAAVFTPREDVVAWLAARRPRLAVAIAADGQPLNALLVYLGCPELSPLFRDQPHLLTPMTLRAEAWLRALASKGSWGGKRAGAGRNAAPPA